jgi:hypothetical protein
MRAVKRSGQTVGSKALTELGGFAPPTLLREASRFVTRQRFVNLVVTNVPARQFPLYLDGRELTDMFPMVPLGSNLNLGIAIVSYNGELNFGLCGDFNAMYDLEDLVGDFLAAMKELAGAAGGGPWPGYDDQPVTEITKRLRGPGEELATRVRSYELERKQRRGVLRAAERELARLGPR